VDCKKQDEGLNVNGMNKDFGGRKKRIGDTRIEQQEGYLGPFQPSFLKPGDTQHFTFREEDEGHYYLEDRSDRKIDRIMTDETRSRKRPKRDLLQELTDREIRPDQGIDIRTICELCI
jgi:hypothetical protein